MPAPDYKPAMPDQVNKMFERAFSQPTSESALEQRIEELAQEIAELRKALSQPSAIIITGRQAVQMFEQIARATKGQPNVI